MEGEFNNLNINNTNITFSVATNNIATSDETSADPIYQRQMGTNYSRARKVGRAVTIVGISLAFTAIAISSGSIISNIFVPNPPTIKDASVIVEEELIKYSFKIENPKNYRTTYCLDVNGENVLKDDCTQSDTYSGEYSIIEKGSHYKFYITFTNSLDYFKTIYVNEFNA